MDYKNTEITITRDELELISNAASALRSIESQLAYEGSNFQGSWRNAKTGLDALERILNRVEYGD